jgi:hypothetical protein
MDSSAQSNEAAKLSIAICTAFFVGILAMILASLGFIPKWAQLIVIPIGAYIISTCMTLIFQYSSCNTIKIQPVLQSTSIILLTNLGVSFVLFLESIPILKALFGPYPARNPLTGVPYEAGTPESARAYENENHYKIQFFSNIVKAVIPDYVGPNEVSESTKEGIVSLYWNFWATLLPLYFSLSVSGLC